MSVRIRIGDEERDLAAASESWISEQLHRRRHDGQNVCLQVIIHSGSLNMRLVTPGCATAGGGRRPTDREQGVFDLWAKRGLDQSDFSAGNAIAFLQQLTRMI